MDFSALSDGMKRLIASAVLLSATIVAPALFVGMSSAALAADTLTVDWPENDMYGYVAGMSYFIKWTPGNAGATVKIELLKAGKRTKWITKKTANDGEYIWTIPRSVKKHSKYKIKITSTKNSTIYDRSDNTFTIYNARNWWKEDFDSTWVIVGIEDDGSGTWENFSVHGNNPHKWRVPSTLVKSAAYKVKITSTKNKKLTDSSDKHFTIKK